ncbi:uncharacterized protein LOC131299941 [Rhododendron vialii]|uniref:uncharacterized protein LOC131299941 n=1 Tax=Rhododendron vialii TaxID=182163 RepID=UPI002660124B|nr:uncharacterized protein LOC131299941 [Rhododendron vialii]
MTTMSKDAARSCVYFRALRSGDYAYDWYKIDDTTDSGTHLSPALPRLPISSELSSCVSLGPAIYVFGGAKVSADGSYVKGHLDELHWIDTLRPDQTGWVKAPPTSRPRALTYQANINGKIYLMGRGVTDVLENTELNCWRSLKPPLVETTPSGHAVLDGGKGFLVNYPLLDALYKFDVVRNTWSVHDLDCGRIGFKTASVDGILFSFLPVPSGRGICGYLVSDSKPFGSPKPVLGLEVLDLISAEDGDYVMNYVPRVLLDAGNGKLCAIYTRDLGVGSGNIKVYCLKFRVSKDFDEVSGETNFLAENPVLSHYYCDDVTNLFDAVSVFPYEGMKTENGVGIEDKMTSMTTMEIRSCKDQVQGGGNNKTSSINQKKKNWKNTKK